jgi:hypothetical protein
MNMQDEKTKGTIAAVIILASLLLFIIRMKRIIFPAAPAAAAIPVAAQGTPAADPASPAPAPNAVASAGGAKSEGADDVLPANRPKGAVKDPFELTASYKSKLPDPRAALASLPVKAPAGFKFGKSAPFPAFSYGKSGAPSLPPAGVNPLPIDPVPGFPKFTNNREMIAAAPAGNAPTLPAPASVPAEPVAPPLPEFALTGTVDGDIPMAILRANNRNYLVHVGDWLENSLQVRQITPRTVELKDRTGRSKILKLGVTVNAT